MLVGALTGAGGGSVTHQTIQKNVTTHGVGVANVTITTSDIPSGKELIAVQPACTEANPTRLLMPYSIDYTKNGTTVATIGYLCCERGGGYVASGTNMGNVNFTLIYG